MNREQIEQAARALAPEPRARGDRGEAKRTADPDQPAILIDRARLVVALLDSLESSDEVRLGEGTWEEVWRDELGRRLQEAREGSLDDLPTRETVMARLRARST